MNKSKRAVSVGSGINLQRGAFFSDGDISGDEDTENVIDSNGMTQQPLQSPIIGIESIVDIPGSITAEKLKKKIT